MEAKQRYEIGQRIKELRNTSQQTNRSIAEYVDIGERSVAYWISGGGITWDNAKKVAALFEVDVQWLWTGREPGTAPDVLSAFKDESVERLERIEEALNGNAAERLAKIEEALERIEARQVEALAIGAEILQRQPERPSRQTQTASETAASDN